MENPVTLIATFSVSHFPRTYQTLAKEYSGNCSMGTDTSLCCINGTSKAWMLTREAQMEKHTQQNQWDRRKMQGSVCAPMERYVFVTLFVLVPYGLNSIQNEFRHLSFLGAVSGIPRTWGRGIMFVDTMVTNNYLEPKWPLFWLEKAFFWRVQPPKHRTNRFQVTSCVDFSFFWGEQILGLLPNFCECM